MGVSLKSAVITAAVVAEFGAGAGNTGQNAKGAKNTQNGFLGTTLQNLFAPKAASV